MAFYAALVAWPGCLALGMKQRRFGAFIAFGALPVVLNARYAVEGTAKSMAFFVGIHDMLHSAVMDVAPIWIYARPFAAVVRRGTARDLHLGFGTAGHRAGRSDPQARRAWAAIARSSCATTG